MIGDTTHDLLMAQNAGSSGIAVEYGAHPVEQLQRLRTRVLGPKRAGTASMAERERLMREEVLICAEPRCRRRQGHALSGERAFGDEATGFVVRYGGKAYRLPEPLRPCAGRAGLEPRRVFRVERPVHHVRHARRHLHPGKRPQCAGGPCRGGKLRPIAVREPTTAIFTGSRTTMCVPQLPEAIT
jgi:hypothetical protein